MLLDTSVAIPLRDGDPGIVARAAALTKAPYLSILTVAELEGGVVAKSPLTALRRRRLDAMLDHIDLLPFDEAAVASYREILTATGFNRVKIIDRLIAATALARGLAVATRNPKDFRDIPTLTVEQW